MERLIQNGEAPDSFSKLSKMCKESGDLGKGVLLATLSAQRAIRGEMGKVRVLAALSSASDKEPVDSIVSGIKADMDEAIARESLSTLEAFRE